MLVAMVGRMMVPKAVHTLIPRICQYVTLKRDVADVMKGTDLQMGTLSWIIQVDSLIT